MEIKPHVILLLGVTASGKSALGHRLAQRFGGEIICVDSMTIYRGMDIGTAKPTPAEQSEVPHHLLDLVEPSDSFSVARFVELADQAVTEIAARGRPVFAVGGTMLYVKCFYEGIFAGPGADASIRDEIRRRAEQIGVEALHAELAAVDPAAAARIHRNDIRRIERAIEVHRLTGQPISALQQQWDSSQLRRPEWRWSLIGLRREREIENRRINERVRRMLAAGLVDEARRIWSDPRGVGQQASQAVGYAELYEHFAGRLALDEANERIKINSRHLAKQQRTWLKRMRAVQWLEATESDSVDSLADRAAELAFAPAQPSAPD